MGDYSSSPGRANARLRNRVEITLFICGQGVLSRCSLAAVPMLCGLRGSKRVLSPQDGTAPLWIASQMGHSEVVRVMLLRGADRDAARHVSLSDAPGHGLRAKMHARGLGPGISLDVQRKRFSRAVALSWVSRNLPPAL